MKKKLVLCFILLCFALLAVADEGSGMEPPPPTLPPGHKPVKGFSPVPYKPRVAPTLVNRDVTDPAVIKKLYDEAETVFMGEVALIRKGHLTKCIGCGWRTSIILEVKPKKIWKGNTDQLQNVSSVLNGDWDKFYPSYLEKKTYIFFSKSSFTNKVDGNKSVDFDADVRVLRIEKPEASIINNSDDAIKYLDSLKD